MNCEDQLTGKLIGLARATDGNEHLISDSSTAVLLESLANMGSDSAVLEKLMDRVQEEKRKMVPDCFLCASPCGKNSDYDMEKLYSAPEDIRSLKCQILLCIQNAAAAACGHRDKALEDFFYKALIVIGMDDYTAEDLLPIVREAEEVKRKYMALTE